MVQNGVFIKKGRAQSSTLLLRLCSAETRQSFTGTDNPLGYVQIAQSSGEIETLQHGLACPRLSNLRNFYNIFSYFIVYNRFLLVLFCFKIKLFSFC